MLKQQQDYIMVETKTTLRIPEDVIKQLKHIAIDENKTLTEIIQEALDEYLANKEEGEEEEAI